MRMRFWATIRRPAFSISALTAPVRLRSVASGLMIEKVRSIAIELRPYKTLGGRCRAYIGATWRRQATRRHVMAGFDVFSACEDAPLPSFRARSPLGPDYNNFTKVNPFCNRHRGSVQLHGPRLAG